jgi:Zn-dependent protease
LKFQGVIVAESQPIVNLTPGVSDDGAYFSITGVTGILGVMFGGLTIFAIVVLVMSILISLTIHEFMHAFVGYKLGDNTARSQGRLSLNPLSHIDPIMTVALPIITILILHTPILAAKPVPFDPENVKYNEYGAALIAAAGPLSNLVLAIITAFLTHASIAGSTTQEVLRTFTQLNVALFVFNMIPIPPLDGSRVVYALAPEPVQDFMRSIEPYGLIIVLGLVFLGGFGGFIGSLNQMVLNLLP